MKYTCAIAFKPILLFGKHLVVGFFEAEFPYVRLGLSMETILDPCWRIVSEGLLEEWIDMGGDSSEEQGMTNIPTLVQGLGYT